MRTNRVVRKSIKSLRSKKRRNKVNRKTKKRTQKRTQKMVKRCKNNRKTKKIKKSYELTGGFGPHMLAAQRRRQQREQEEERIRQEEERIRKEEAMSRLEKYKEEEERTAKLFGEYEKIINRLTEKQLKELLKGMDISDSRVKKAAELKPYEKESQKMDRLQTMVRYNAHKLKESNHDLWNKYFGHSEIIQNYYRGSPVMETSSPTTFQNPLAE